VVTLEGDDVVAFEGGEMIHTENSVKYNDLELNTMVDSW
jgi:uncharacterized SAM-dependent methyltransferase